MSQPLTRVTLTWAQTLNGYIALSRPSRLSLSGKESMEVTHRLRSEHTAILVGVNTVLSDDPRLTCRLGKVERQPVRIILDSRLRTPPTARLFEDIEQAELWILCVAPDAAREKNLRDRHARVIRLPDLNPTSVRRFLSEAGVASVMVEGGSAVLSSFWQQRVYDRLVITVTPTFLGSGIPALNLKNFSIPDELFTVEGGVWSIQGRDAVFDWSKR